MFERMVRSTKRCLRKAVGSRRLTFEELNTVLIEIEAVLNSRPITYIYEDDIEVPLTPSHLFCGRRLFDKDDQAAEIANEDIMMTRKDMIKGVKHGEAVVEHFWKRWRREYLVDLRENQKLHVQKQKPIINIGDVVLIEVEGAKRNKWRLGRIEEIVTGKDGVIRGANVKTSKGKLSRPLQKLYPLEVHEDLQSTENGEYEDTDGPSSVPTDHLTPDTTPSKTTQNSQTAPLPKKLSVPSHLSVKKPYRSEIEAKSYGSTTSSRPTRTAGTDGEAKRRMVERK